jgi:hypothetical protein
MRIGLGLLAIAFLLTYSMGFVPIRQVMGAYLLTIALMGVSGFGFLVLSIFLPRDKREKPTFTQELLGKEKLQYGNFTEGNWKSVLDEKTKDKKKRRYRK